MIRAAVVLVVAAVVAVVLWIVRELLRPETEAERAQRTDVCPVCGDTLSTHEH